jgi:hypothetical protein
VTIILDKEGSMTVATVTAQKTRTRAPAVVSAGRYAGIGGLVFAAALVVQNIIRAKGPSLDAAPGAVSSYFLHHRVAALIPLGMFPIEMLALFAFVAGVWTSASRSENRWWATMGVLAAAAIASLFALDNIIEIVLTAKAETLVQSPRVVEVLWAVHAAAFGLDFAAIAVALIGLSRAATASALMPARLGTAVLPGAVFLLLASVFTVALTNGGPWLGVALVGFILWLVFMVATSISLLRTPQIP